MSKPDAATAALDEAIRAYAAAERPGDVVTGWFMVAVTAVAADDGIEGTLGQAAPGQAISTTLGLIDMAREQLHRHLANGD